MSGTVPAGRICLLLGPPASGKSTLLQALAGKLDEGGPMTVCLCASPCNMALCSPDAS